MNDQVSPNARSHVMGFPVDSLTMTEAIRCIDKCLQGQKFNHVVAINANKFWLSERIPALKAIVQNAELVIPEYAAVWACRFLGRSVRGHIGGVMLLKALLPWLEEQGVPIFLLGAKPGVLELMRARLLSAYPELKVVGTHSGYFESDQENGITQSINQSGAKLIFVAMGTPRQEFWIERHRKELRANVAMGVGGSFDVVAGIKRDAPSWIRHGGEWIYRLAQDPGNLWKRYLRTNPWFVYRVLRERMLMSR